MTAVLLGTLLFLGQLAWASLAVQAPAPTGCHHHAPQPAPENSTHQCCAVGHNSALAVQHDAGKLANLALISADVQPSTGSSFHMQRPQFSFQSAFPPGSFSLRI
jgi:hypothetical protein